MKNRMRYNLHESFLGSFTRMGGVLHKYAQLEVNAGAITERVMVDVLVTQTRGFKSRTERTEKQQIIGPSVQPVDTIVAKQPPYVNHMLVGLMMLRKRFA